MKHSRAVLILLIVTLVIVPAFAASANQTSEGAGDDVKTLGRRIFQQRCGVCHSEVTLTNHKRYGPALYKDLVQQNEDMVRETIEKGRPGLMPGFQYGLKPSEISAIIEYLRTVSRPAKSNSGSTGEDVKD